MQEFLLNDIDLERLFVPKRHHLEAMAVVHLSSHPHKSCILLYVMHVE
jgi:hypothetical protein